VGGRTAGAAFEFRTSPDGLTWPDWRTSDVEAASVEASDAEALSGLLEAPRHGFLQYKVRLRAGAEIGQVTAFFLNSQDGPTVDVPVVRERENPEAIDYSRTQWRCDERLRFQHGKESWPRRFVPVKKLVVHHTVTPGEYEDGAAEVRAIYTYHARILGWGDIGYNALVDRFGRSYEGRYGQEQDGLRDVYGADVVGAHASNHNRGSSGVALIGQFHGEGAPEVPQPMLDRLVDVLEHRARQSRIDPLGSSDFLLSNGELREDMPNLVGHRDCGPTACPGDNAYKLLDGVRIRLAERLGV
jgi:hypothetical protein